MQQPATSATPRPVTSGEGASPWFERGRDLAASLSGLESHGRRTRPPHTERHRARTLLARLAAQPRQEYAAWVLDNLRLIDAAGKESRELDFSLHLFPVAIDAAGKRSPRIVLLASAYLGDTELHFEEAALAEYLDGFQCLSPLTMGEIWALRPALQRELLRLIEEQPPSDWPALVPSLRRCSETSWKDLFGSVSHVDRILARDPVAAYREMDFESCDLYRRAVGELAKHSGHSETEVAEAAIGLAGRGSWRRAHVGYYLIDSGRDALEKEIGYRPTFRARINRLLRRYPTGIYLLSVELAVLLLVFVMLSGRDSWLPLFAGLLLLILPATQAAVELVNSLVTALLPPRLLPKLDFSEGIPDHCATLVAVPSLLLNEAQVQDLVLDLEIRYLANRDPNLYFALLTDSPDSDQREDSKDALVDVCRTLIEGLNRRYRTGGRAPFFLFHRHRAYNESEGRWMGWERKRGKLLDLNRLLRGGFDAFPVKVGDLSRLRRTRYVITLDSDTQLPRESAARLIGAIAHPLNRPVVHPVHKVVVEGYGILQPRIGISIQSASRSRLAALYSGQTGFDIYTRAISDVYQDLFGAGIFTGKGIYDVDAMREVLERRFPENALLSHDLIEGSYARTALVSDIELIDDYPSHFSAYNRRKHRWVRGDWQILGWIRTRVPDIQGRLIANPIPLIARWNIIDNLRRSLLEPGILLLFLGGWLFLPGSPKYWTAANVALLFLPVYSALLFAILRIPAGCAALRAWAGDTLGAFVKSNAMAFFSVLFLLHQALVSLDAIVRTIARLFVTRRKLLEWETAAQAEATTGRKATVDVYLEWTPWLTLVIAIAVALLRPQALPAAVPVLVLWLISRPVSGWLNRQPRTGNCKLSEPDIRLLRDSAERTYRFFRDWSSPATNWLIPDSVAEDGAADLRVSPTNLGMLLNARIAGVHLGLVPLAEFVHETRQTLDRMLGLTRHRGHFLNWNDVTTLQPLEPRFVSTVDSGNLAASLWTLKQAALKFASEPAAKRAITDDLADNLDTIAGICDRLVQEMNFALLYEPRKKVLSVGFDVTGNRREPSCYDLLATEARIASFIAIAKGDIPQSAWFHLGRAHTLARGERVLLSWTGTMFEYLMPAIWMHHYRGTILEQSIRAAVRVQREYARKKGVPWGISESACLTEVEGQCAYAPFGIPDLATRRMDGKDLVIAPYATFLAACADAPAAIDNLRRMEEFGWLGRYGFYEAIDYRQAGGVPVRTWMAHHQGMSLLSVVNLLHDCPIQRYFHAEPHVLATELLLNERVPAAALAEPEAFSLPDFARAGNVS